jgi:flagellum-specific peptidoglycan hydrolase FlgJ
MDRNYISFRDNLMHYVDLLRDGITILTEKYDNLVEEKNHPSQTATPLLTFQYGA